MSQFCLDRRRRDAVAAHPTLNGIDSLEVIDREATTPALRQRTLLLRLLKPVPTALQREQVVIEGGERVRDIAIEWVAPAAAPPADLPGPERDSYTAQPEAASVLVVRLNRHGDASTYRLRLRRSPLDDEAPPGIDPRLAAVAFSFKVECPSDFDCRTSSDCPPEQAPDPGLDYLARDYASLRRFLLDRLTLLVPGWRERSAADLGVTLAELIAYAADQLSYRQDAIASEAYLETARRRSSLRRHALLVDYPMHDGCNARVWLQLQVQGTDVILRQATTRFYTHLPGAPIQLQPDSPRDVEALAQGPLIFEPLHEATLRESQNAIPFHCWGDERCCLPRGATAATLKGHPVGLGTGSVLLFEECLGPATGQSSDADPGHRHVVRLTAARAGHDPLSDEPITDIRWAPADALPFPLCLSAITDPEHGGRALEGVSIARGNMVLADHGFSLPQSVDLGSVPAGGRFRPGLACGPLTFAASVPDPSSPVPGRRRAFDPAAPASAALACSPGDALPQIRLEERRNGVSQPWRPRRHLLDSDGDAPEFVVEVEEDGRAGLRFGDDAHGRRPLPGSVFQARCRIGQGSVGNVGAEAIQHIVHPGAGVVAVRNPLPAVGGTEPESAASVRRRAPQAFRWQERAVTPDDYAAISTGHPGVQRAAAGLRWTGSWHTVFVTVDRSGGLPVDAPFARSLADRLERYRMAGHDIEVRDPRFVSLEIELLVCVAAGHLRSDVRAALLAELGSGTLPDGRRGLFHPDNLVFGQTIRLSPIYAAARRVAGVASLQARCFQRQGQSDARPLLEGCLRLAPLEIARLENNADWPEHGVLRLDLHGGR